MGGGGGLYLRKIVSLLLLVLILMLVIDSSNVIAAQLKEPHIVVIYSSNGQSDDSDRKLLDLLLGHFSSEIDWIDRKQVEQQDIEDANYLFYYGLIEEKLPKTTQELINSFEGTFVAIGHNVAQFHTRFSFTTKSKTVHVSMLSSYKDDAEKLAVDEIAVLPVEFEKNSDALSIITATVENQTIPVLIKEQQNYYYATTNLFPPSNYLFADYLHDVFNVKTDEQQQLAYVRIEDIHPRVDVSKLKAVIATFEQRQIPYMIAVTPVYKHPESGDVFYLWQNETLIEVLQEAQAGKGTIILHGYTDQFDSNETGTGFEFRDKNNHTPLSGGSETTYITDRIEKGVQALIDHQLYPLAFEVPHYAMSQQGYQLLAGYFSTMVGQIQLDDSNWKVMSESPYITKIPFLNGLTLIPETARYVHHTDPTESINRMKAKIKAIQFVRDGVIGVFHHPFMEVEQLTEILDEIASIKDVKWLDMKTGQHTVQTSFVNIQSNNGVIEVNEPASNPQKLDTSILDQTKETRYLIWTIIGACMVAMMVFLSISRLRKMK